MANQDCYFFFDSEKNQNIPEGQQKLSVICLPCRDEHYPGVGWFWKGSKEGYGPWKYICCQCGNDVNFDAEGDNEEA